MIDGKALSKSINDLAILSEKLTRYSIAGFYCVFLNFANFAILNALAKIKVVHIFESIYLLSALAVDTIIKNRKYFF